MYCIHQLPDFLSHQCSGNSHLYMYCIPNIRTVSVMRLLATHIYTCIASDVTYEKVDGTVTGNSHLYMYCIENGTMNIPERRTGNSHLYMYCIGSRCLLASSHVAGNSHLYMYCISKFIQK